MIHATGVYVEGRNKDDIYGDQNRLKSLGIKTVL